MLRSPTLWLKVQQPCAQVYWWKWLGEFHGSVLNTLGDIQFVVLFIWNYAKDYAILLPGRITGYKRDDLVLLHPPTQRFQYRTSTMPYLRVLQVAGYCSPYAALETAPASAHPSLQAHFQLVLNMPTE